MPLYEYECLRNRHHFEIRQPITSDALKECPECGSEVRRIIHPVGIVFKGSGFYATDSRGKGMSTSHKSAESGGESKTGGPESKGESKTEPPKDSKSSTENKSSTASSEASSSSGSKNKTSSES